MKKAIGSVLFALALIPGGWLLLNHPLSGDPSPAKTTDHAAMARSLQKALGRVIRGEARALLALRRPFLQQDQVTRKDFKAMTAPLLSRHPAWTQVHWIPPVPAHRRSLLEARARDEGRPDFVFRDRPQGSPGPGPAPVRDLHLPLFYSEPDRSGAVPGFDFAGEQSPFVDLLETRARGRLTARFLPEGAPWSGDDRPALLLILPMRAPGAVFAGFLLGVLDVSALSGPVLAGGTTPPAGTGLTLYGGSHPAGPSAAFGAAAAGRSVRELSGRVPVPGGELAARWMFMEAPAGPEEESRTRAVLALLIFSAGLLRIILLRPCCGCRPRVSGLSGMVGRFVQGCVRQGRRVRSRP